MNDFRAGHPTIAIAKRDVARPKVDIIEARPRFHSEENYRVAMLGATHLGRPEYFHEIAGLRLREVVEVLADAEFVKQARRAGSIRIPASPNSFAIALSANHQLLQGREIQIERTVIAQGFDCFDENEIGCARAVARRRSFGENKKLS